MEIVSWFESNPISATIVVALIAATPPVIALVVSTWRYIGDRRGQLRQQRFENFHKLVSDLVEGREEQPVPRLDSQIAVVFELRNYPEYREVSTRILEGLREKWSSESVDTRLIEEMDYTLQALQDRCTWKRRSRGLGPSVQR